MKKYLILSFFFFSPFSYACPPGFELARESIKLSDLVELNALAYIKKRVDIDYQMKRLDLDKDFSFVFTSRTYRRYLRPKTLRKISIFNNFCEIALSHYQRFGHFWIRLKKCGDQPLNQLPPNLFNYLNFCLPVYGPIPL